MAWQPPKVTNLVGNPKQNIVVPGSRTIIYGQWQTWKSMLTMDMGYALTTGTPWLGFPTMRSGVAILQIEIPKYMFQQRMISYLAPRNNIMPPNLFVASEPFYKMDAGPQYDLDTQLVMLTRNYGVRTIIIDPLYRTISRDVNNNHEVSRLLDFIDEKIIGVHGLAVVLVGHTKKPNMDEVVDPDSGRDMAHELIGASFLANWADTLISVQHTNPALDEVRITYEKTRHALERIQPQVVRVKRSTLEFQLQHAMRIGV